MKNLLFLWITIVLLGCSYEKELQSTSEIENEITKTFDNLYEDYKKFDVESFTSYYQDDVIRMGKDGNYQVGKEIFKKGWYESAEKHERYYSTIASLQYLLGRIRWSLSTPMMNCLLTKKQVILPKYIVHG